MSDLDYIAGARDRLIDGDGYVSNRNHLPSIPQFQATLCLLPFTLDKMQEADVANFSFNWSPLLAAGPVSKYCQPV